MSKFNGLASLSEVTEAVHTGIKKAYKDYHLLSTYTVCQAPEYFLTVKIADALKGLKLYVDLECSVNHTLDKAGAKQPGPIPKDIRRNGRFDFVAHYYSDKPRFIGEVKNSVSTPIRLENDLKRICHVLDYGKTNSFQSGIIAFYAYKKIKKNSPEKLEELISNIKKKCTEAGSKFNCKIKMTHEPLARYADYASDSVCMVISK